MSDLTNEPLGAGRVETRELEQEVRTSFLDYAMSVIVSRALPDVRDGLKPVHRRVLYAMHEAGLQPNRPTRKSARVVGDVMGNYHPHGDAAIYDALVRLAQPFSMRYPLVDGQGYFGSVDGDPAGAMRYTECRLSRMATEMLRDIDANTVDFVPNYDESRRQPEVLPARFPNLLVNGSTGIAVGMATNIAPHNLGEVVNGIVAMIDDPSIDVERLSRHIKGPDFPTGGTIVGRAGIRDAYRSGRGRITVRGRAHIEQLRGGKSAIIITELPYGVRKAGEGGVIEKIADLVKAGTLTEVPMSDDALQDHSDKEGMRIYVELKRDAVPQVALNKLFKLTPLQTTFGYNAVALVDGVPRTLSLLELIRYYLDYQRDVVTRRSKYELRQAEKRAHVLEGYLEALDNLDAVITLIRNARDTDDAREGLMRDFELSEVQAQAILDLRLARLTGLARTEIVAAEEELELEDLIAEEDMVIAITRSNYIKRLPVTAYREQRRGGIGVMGMELKDEDYIEHLFPFRQGEQVRAVVQTRDFQEAKYLVFATKNGVVKKTELAAYNTPLRADGIIAIKMRDGDELVSARHSSGEDEVLMVSRKGQAIRFSEQDARPMGRDTAGVKGMSLRKGDEVISCDVVSVNEGDLLVVTENGYGKRTRLGDYPRKGRGGLGVKTAQLVAGEGRPGRAG